MENCLKLKGGCKNEKVLGNQKGVADVICVAVVVWVSIGLWGYFVDSDHGAPAGQTQEQVK